MTYLSVVLATHNEEKNLEKCLFAIQDLADEVVIVDGESSDNTVALAKKLGAKVLTTTNKPNFHINKQLAMDQAKGLLVLQLDADEVVDPELHDFIASLISQLKLKQSIAESAWWIKRKNYFMGRFLKKGGQYPDPVIRLYLQGQARLPQQDVHEQMVVNGPVGWASGHLLHYGNPTFQEYLRKFNTYTSFKATQLADQHLQINLMNSFQYLLIKPVSTFFSIYVRHRGYVDGIPGFTFALFSGFHHTIAYLKLWEMTENSRKKNV